MVIGDNAFNGCNLSYVEIPNSVTTIGKQAFRGCTNLSYVEIGSGITSIGQYAFYNCDKLDTYVFHATTPPTLNLWSLANLFNPVKKVYVPCKTAISYKTAPWWKNYKNFSYIEPEAPVQMTLYLNDSLRGEIQMEEHDGHFITCSDSMAILKATSNYGYHFDRWSNGSINNPDTLYLQGDSCLTAFFEKNVYAIAALTEDSVMGVVSGSDSIDYLDKVFLSATPNYGYHFQNWSDGNTDNPRQVQVLQDSVFVAQFAKNVYSVYLSVDSVNCGSTFGGGLHYYLDQLTLEAMPNYGYHFTAWSDGDTTNPRTLVLTQDTAFTAIFDKNIYAIDALTEDSVMGWAAGSDSVAYLDSVTLTATANYGYHFTKWSDGNNDNPRTVQVKANKTYTAQFAKNTYTIALSVDTAIHGSTTGNGSYLYLDQLTLEATPNYGYHFTAWSDGDTNNPRTLILTQDTAFTALFDKNVYTIVTASNDTAMGYATGSGMLEYLDTLTLTANCTAEHHHFVRWSDGVTDAVRVLTVERDSLLTAIFAIDTHSVVVAANDESYGTVNGPTEAAYGSTIVLTAEAAEGYHFGQWSDGTMENPYALTLTSDTAVTALFTPDLYPTLCMVGVQGNRNVLQWERVEEPCTAYRLYREGSVAGQYELMAEVPTDSATHYVDSLSRPMTRSYRYRISGVDPYGHEGEQSAEHKTMHLTISQGVGNQWNLVWTEYEGAEYTTYVIYRGTSMNDLQQIDVMPSGGNTTYTDTEAPEGEVYYQVGVMMSNPCGGDEPETVHATKGASISRSNIATNGEVGIGTVDESSVVVRVENGQVVVEAAEDQQVVLYDMTGRVLGKVNESAGVPGFDSACRFDVPASGTYLVKVGNYPARRVVVVR